MCGIAGLVGTNNEASLRAMCAAIRHRGPDDEGLFVSDAASLATRRLSIIDLAGGHQPLANEDGSIWIAFNGEIYNFPELRQRLEQAGHTFRTKTDTETIVHAYEEYGDDCVLQLNGMFAFALWDSKHDRLLLARDRLGIKPVYYAQLNNGALAFASEIKALRRLPQLSLSLDLTALDQYLRLQFIPAPRTIFSGVKKLAAGHRLIWEKEQETGAFGLRTECYWAPRFEPNQDLSEDEWLARLDAELMRSVEMQMISDVPLGAFLSGGIDSTAVVAAMSRLTDRPVKTFTIGFDDPRYDESPYASAVAKHLGTDHHHAIVGRGIDSELFARLIAQLDEPLADSSFIPTYHVARLAREQVKVVLTGDGGDETFAGYQKYQTMLAWNSRWQKVNQAIKPMRASLRRAVQVMPRGRRTAELLTRTPTERFAEIAYRYYSFDQSLYGPDLARSTDGVLWGLIDDAVREEEPVAQLQHTDYLTYLPEDILMKVDKMTMAVSLEARVPLLDHKLQELAMTMPASVKMRGHDGKYLLKKWLRGQVPDLALDRPKIGFAPTLSYWLDSGWHARAAGEVLEGYGVRQGLFRRESVERLIRQRDLPRLWNLWVWETWARDAGL